MRKVLVFLLLLVALGCDLPRTEYSKDLEEPATVCETVYTPATHGESFGPTISLSGKIGFVTVKYREVYRVVEGSKPVLTDYDFIDAILLEQSIEDKDSE